MMTLGQVRLAQLGQAGPSPYEEAVRTGVREIRDWDALLFRLAAVSDDDGRTEILSWLSRADIPGSPAERYAAVRDTIVNGDQPDEVFANRVSQLDNMISDFDAMVSKAESSGTLPSPRRMGAGSTPEEGTTLSKCIAGGVALLGLIVIPLILD